MKKAKVLFVSSEITPYTEKNEISRIGRELPQGIQEKGKEIRTFMPRYGCINERRNQLHEVIRLSGLNIIINDDDHPLIIKVASIQSARMQVYFIDNEEYFQRKALYQSKKGKFFEDNDERAIFFARGVIETVKKLGWAPDIIHCHGWMSSVVPLYIKKAYNDDPLFSDSKVIYSVYNDEFSEKLDDKMIEKIKFDGIEEADLGNYTTPDYVNISKAAIDNSDAVIYGSEEVHADVDAYVKSVAKPTLNYQDPNDYVDAYSEFYGEILVEEEVLAD